MQLQVHILPTKFAFCRVFLPLPFRSTRHSLCRFSAPNPGAAPSGWGLDDRLFIKKARTIKLLKRLQRITKADQSFNQPQNHKKKPIIQPTNLLPKLFWINEDGSVIHIVKKPAEKTPRFGGKTKGEGIDEAFEWGSRVRSSDVFQHTTL